MPEKLTAHQVSEFLQVELSTIRFWEKEFSEYLKVNCSKGKRKRYTEEQLEVFAQIKELLYTELYTIKGAKRRLELENSLTSALGIEQNFKSTVMFMLSSIMEELQESRKESLILAEKVELLRQEKEHMENKLLEEQDKSLLKFLRDKFSSNDIDAAG